MNLDREAEAAYREAVRLEPDDPAVRTSLGVLLSAMGRNKEASAQFGQARRLTRAGF